MSIVWKLPSFGLCYCYFSVGCVVISVCAIFRSAVLLFRSVLLLFFGLCCYFGLCYCYFSVCADCYFGMCYCFFPRSVLIAISVCAVISVCADCYFDLCYWFFKFGLCWPLFRSVRTVISVCAVISVYADSAISVCADCYFGLCWLLFRCATFLKFGLCCTDCYFGVQRIPSVLPLWHIKDPGGLIYTNAGVIWQPLLHWPSRSIVSWGAVWRVCADVCGADRMWCLQ